MQRLWLRLCLYRQLCLRLLCMHRRRLCRQKNLTVRTQKYRKERQIYLSYRPARKRSRRQLLRSFRTGLRLSRRDLTLQRLRRSSGRRLWRTQTKLICRAWSGSITAPVKTVFLRMMRGVLSMDLQVKRRLYLYLRHLHILHWRTTLTEAIR